jgi:hypothetical protein
MDAKLKWFERSWAAKAKDKSAAPSASAAEAPTHNEAEAGEIAKPGAVAVPGPGYEGDNDDDVSTFRLGGGGREEGDEAATDTPLQVDSYAVNEEGPSDEELRQRILASTAHAEAVVLDETSKPRRYCSTSTIFLLVVAVATAIAIGVAVPLATRKQSSEADTLVPDDEVVAYLKYMERQGRGGFAGAMNAEIRISSDGSLVTSGAMELILCRPKVCLESDEQCLVGDKTYEPGCCAGPDCPVETKCGEKCPKPPVSCYLNDPDNATCIRSECYTCNQSDGKDIYVLSDYVHSIDCLEVGTAIRPENGETYKWAIFCGPVIVGPSVEENRDLGEYQCGAVRLGANYSDDHGGLLVGEFPCQFIALAECGCGPSDMFTFGLPEPTGPCLPEDGCPFLCEDVGVAYARNLCHAFPGNISWWEGQNAFNSSMFYENLMAPDYEFEIYIKGVDD